MAARPAATVASGVRVGLVHASLYRTRGVTGEQEGADGPPGVRGGRRTWGTGQVTGTFMGTSTMVARPWDANVVISLVPRRGIEPRRFRGKA